jgi:hypothetical protein
MNDFDFNDFQDLQEFGVEAKEATKPEDEFFHSVYIAGQLRENHAGIKEQPGLLQVRGVEYNLQEVHMIVTHTKEVNSKEVERNQRRSIECFSFKEGQPPYFGTSNMPDGSKRQCPPNAEQRGLNEFCNPCRSQIIVAGIYCKPDGAPILDEDKKPIFVFIRGKGMKYSNVSNYLNDCFKMELPPLFTPPTEESTRFEKSVVNNKRHVTKITIGTANSRFGQKNVFELATGTQLPNKTVYDILQVAKKTKEKFNEKFDWSKGKMTSASGYGEQTKSPDDGLMKIDDGDNDANTPPEKVAEEPKQETFSFDSVNF